LSIAVFIQPSKNFGLEIHRWKKRVQSELNDQPYVLDPPHLTLINLEIQNEKKALNTISEISKNLNPIELLINTTGVFWNDMLTGGHTIYFGIKNNKALKTLQKIIAEKLSVYTEDKDNSINKHKLDEPFLSSQKKYGSPFVGGHWIPHFSISSLHTKKDHPIINDFLLLKPNFKCIANKLSVWHINNNNHTKLKTFFLNEKS